MKNVKVIIATHKDYDMPKDKIYLPLQIGAKINEGIGFRRDDSYKDNISDKNSSFCELTGLYYAWKHIKADYIGLVHYRRHFKSNNKKDKNPINNVITHEEVDRLLNSTDIILPKKRKYFIETLYSHYKHTMYVEPLDIVGVIIKNRQPKYYSEFLKLKKRRSAHMFNMFIMNKELLNDYCKWLFDILFELEDKCSNLKYNSFHSRFYGRISELLLDVWINTNGYSYKEVKVLNTEKVNWFKKGFSFLKAKFLGSKYEKSF